MTTRCVSLLLAGLLWITLFGEPAAADERCRAAAPDCAQVAALLDQREGYGALAAGGLGGAVVTVTSAADAGPGSLREALATASRPTWIRFGADLTIRLHSQLRVPANVSIDGRGHKVTLLDYGLGIYGSSDVIVTHLTIDGEFRTFSQAINVANGARRVWIDHLDLSRFNDRLLNVKNGATDVTISWTKFHDHNKVMLLNNLTSKDLFSSYDRDSIARVTLHHCYFVDVVQRNPRAQIGTFHLYNNLLEDWDLYGMSFSLEARATIEGNIFRNIADRPCWEPASFKTIEGVEANYCRAIAGSPARTALRNGAADRRAYDATKGTYGYTHQVEAFLKVRDNLYLGDAKAVLTDAAADRVPPVPYCYSYSQPTPELAAVLRHDAGNTDTVPPKEQKRCPAT